MTVREKQNNPTQIFTLEERIGELEKLRSQCESIWKTILEDEWLSQEFNQFFGSNSNYNSQNPSFTGIMKNLTRALQGYVNIKNDLEKYDFISQNEINEIETSIEEKTKLQQESEAIQAGYDNRCKDYREANEVFAGFVILGIGFLLLVSSFIAQAIDKLIKAIRVAHKSAAIAKIDEDLQAGNYPSKKKSDKNINNNEKALLKRSFFNVVKANVEPLMKLQLRKT